MPFVCDATLAFIQRCDVLSVMADFHEQCACIKFCFKLGKTATECYEMLKTVFGEKAMGHFQTNTQSSQWKSLGTPPLKKSRQVQNNIKSMLICFFGQKGNVHKEFVPPGQTVNAAFYVEVLNVCGRMCEGSDLISGGTTHDCSTTTMRQPVLPP